jgi:hypothetical protein
MWDSQEKKDSNHVTCRGFGWSSSCPPYLRLQCFVDWDRKLDVEGQIYMAKRVDVPTKYAVAGDL